MKVILQKDIVNIGDAGDIKDVADGYARNFLFPRKLAVKANDSNTKAILHQKRLADLKREKRTKTMKDVSLSLEGKSFETKVKVGEKEKLFGSVTAGDISVLLKKAGIEVDKRKIDLQDPIRSLGEFKIKIKLADGINPTILVKVVGES